jgi:hypothetical protein
MARGIICEQWLTFPDDAATYECGNELKVGVKEREVGNCTTDDPTQIRPTEQARRDCGRHEQGLGLCDAGPTRGIPYSLIQGQDRAGKCSIGKTS